MREEMPKGGVNELLKSPSGREHLANLQKRHWKDLLQPSDPRFQKVYGKEIEDRNRRLEETKRKGQEQYEEQKRKQEWEQQNQWRTR